MQNQQKIKELLQAHLEHDKNQKLDDLSESSEEMDDGDEEEDSRQKDRQKAENAGTRSAHSAGYPKINIFTKWDDVNEMFQDEPDWQNSDELDRIM